MASTPAGLSTPYPPYVGGALDRYAAGFTRPSILILARHGVSPGGGIGQGIWGWGRLSSGTRRTHCPKISGVYFCDILAATRQPCDFDVVVEVVWGWIHLGCGLRLTQAIVDE